MELESAINRHFSQLNENEKAIIEYIINHKKECKELTIIEIAKVTLTSKSSILRLAKKLGFSGYSEFKYSLQKDNSINSEEVSTNNFMSMQQGDVDATRKLFEQINSKVVLKELDEAERIFCYGTGWGQRDVLSDFRRSLIPLNRYPILLSAKKELEMASRQEMSENDLLIVVSLSGDIAEIRDEIRLLKMKNVSILSITNISNNSLASMGTYNLYFQSTPKKYKGEAVYSFVPLHLTMDNLFRSYVDYKNEEEGEIHV
ncbi:MurR/RpiR family transcriptional regulator [Lacticigenium naphthae]|uniref:MurR/RpiR family transcriptional regulator n=1 Tax=Lacticigenium naphthae TaxID=515351 RepID=UPI0003F6B338|nr:MurR/RpiR family transcriptional regulator [Lacticigenium naphthae]